MATSTIEISISIEKLDQGLIAAESKLKKFGEAAEKLGSTLNEQVTSRIIKFSRDSIKAFSELQKDNGIIGIDASFQKLSNSVNQSSLKFGEAIEKAFDISGKLNMLSEIIDSVTAKFESLSPGTQKAILVIVGIVAAIGPLLMILGNLATTVIPAVVAGFSVLSSAFAVIFSPIGLLVAAIVGAVILIIKNWDEIVAYFTTGDGRGVFDSLTSAISAAITFIEDLWNDMVDTLKEFWDEWGTDIIAVAKKYFDILSSYFKIVFDVISGIFKAGSAFIKGDWAELGKVLATTAQKVWNGIIDIIAKVVRTGTDLMAKFFEFIGFDSFANKLKVVNNAIVDLVKNKLSFNIPIEVKAKESKKNEKVESKKNATLKTVSNETGNKKEEINKKLNTELQKNKVQFGDDESTIATKNIESYQAAINSLIEIGYKPWSKEIQTLITKQKELSAIQIAKQRELSGFKEGVLAPLKGQTTIDATLPTTDLQAKVSASMTVKPTTNLSEVSSKLNEDFAGLSQGILDSGVQDAFGAVGASIGETLANGGNIMQSLGTSLLSIVGNIAVQLGKAAIGVGIGMKAIKEAFKNPFLAIAAGVALIAIGSFINSKVANITNGKSADGNAPASAASMKQFANGGIVYGPTVGLMGEYAGASSNPEVIAPLNKLKDLLPQSQANTFIPDLQLKGEDIFISFKRASKRLGGLT